MVPMDSVISGRGSSFCRACGESPLISIFELGSHPLPSEYGATVFSEMDAFPLELKICTKCGLGQIGEYVSRERIFHSAYPYISSASSTWVTHTTNFANQMCASLKLEKGSLVVELASNDGSLLAAFQNLGMNVLGVEPATDLANLANLQGIPTLTEFFGEEVAGEIKSKYGEPKLIVANNVFAHVPDMLDFTMGLNTLTGDETVITIENPSFVNLLNNSLFDTIYHEHYSYITAHSVSTIANRCGLRLNHVEKLKTHGGSNRYWLSTSGTVSNSVQEMLEEEKIKGLFDPNVWEEFAKKSQKSIDGLRDWLIDRRLNSDTVVAYGAAHKGNTFLNAVGNESRYIKYVVDASIEKQGKFLPGSKIPVLPPEKLQSGLPTDVLILPWNIEEELTQRIRELAPNARIWVAQPFMRQIL